MGERYFSATAMAGRLYVQGIPDRGPWDPKQLVYYSEEIVDKMMQPLAGDRKVKTAEELAEAVRVSERGLPTIKVWIHGGLGPSLAAFSQLSQKHFGLRLSFTLTSPPNPT